MENYTSKTWIYKTLSIVLGLVILAALAALVYVILVPQANKAFTEFYILGPGGQTTDYPDRVQAGEEVEVILGIGNHENDEVLYRVEIRADGDTIGGLEPISLENSDRFEQPVMFTLDVPPGKQKVEFLLYKEGQSEVYKSLHLWIDVTK